MADKSKPQPKAPPPASQPKSEAPPPVVSPSDVTLPPDFVAMYPDAPTRQTTPVTDTNDARKFHTNAFGPYCYSMAGQAARAAGKKQP